MKLTFTLFLSIGVSLAQADDLSIIETLAIDNRINIFNGTSTDVDLGTITSGGGPFTVFAPTDDAFFLLDLGVVTCLLAPPAAGGTAGALETMLNYHVASGKVTSDMLSNDQKVETLEGSEVTVTISGDRVMINQAKVTTADVIASNGVIHVIDQVLLPSDNAVIADIIERCPRSRILGTARRLKLFTLVDTLKEADLVDDPLAGLVGTLSGDGPFTVFAPTDDAFAMVDQGVLGCLREPDNKQELTDVLLYHVASGKVTSDMLSNDQKVDTLEGNDATVTISGDGVKINEATVTNANVLSANGVIHVIDQVLIPTDNAGITALIDRCALQNTLSPTHYPSSSPSKSPKNQKKSSKANKALKTKVTKIPK